MTGHKVALSGSLRIPPEGATLIGDVDPDEPLSVVVHVKRRTPDMFAPGSAGDLARLTGKPLTRRALAAQRRRTHARAAARIEKRARASGLKVGDIDLAQRTVVIEGTARQMADVFGATLRCYDDGRHQFRARVGQLMLPSEIAPWTRAVLGFDQRPLAAPAHRLQPQAGDGTGVGLWPSEIASLYGIPTDRDVSSVCVGIVALGGGYLASDLATAMAAMGRSVPDVIDVTVEGDGNQFVDGFSLAEQEIALDLQVAASLLPKARIVVYFANNSTDSLTRAVHRAVFDDVNRPQVVSVSWGNSERSWTDTSRDAMQAVLADAIRLRVSVTFAAGDLLATGGLTDGRLHVWFPASSPYALGCGGTAPTLNEAGSAVVTEAVWNQAPIGTGGGISDVFPIPAYQSGLALPVSLNDGAVRRGVPDVACAAADRPGYRIVLNGQEVVKDGTSAATPLWAALLAMANAGRETPVGFVNSALYSNSALCRLITKGDNRVDGRGYDAGPGWSACTGLGVPKGADILAVLGSLPTV
ncbi:MULTISPECIES: S53 family peptidase [unclassified Bradyrhizobium]|uniref:S53 family peptidase n=1 Tax=unclassified Bradyrhizobium TaxID=2631580 RepID=UPI00291670EF|nr:MULTISPECIES: S53 family peptidase [unclassified Bradyrhizobium]